MKYTKHKMTNAELHIIRALHGLTATEIAEATGEKVGTIRSWLNKPTSSAYRGAKDDAVRLLKSQYSMTY